MPRKPVKRSSAAASLPIAVDASAPGVPIRLERYALGQGGLADVPIFASHEENLRWLEVKVIRLFIQEYFDVYPAHGVYHWDTLDASVESILRAGAKPLMSICIKPPALYPEINQDKVHPSDYAEWEELIYRMVRRYNIEKGNGIEYWEVFNEPDIGESGGCPGRFTPEDYCTYYEHTVRAIRRADPKAKVGGPALAYHKSPLLPALLDLCSKKGVPIDFVSWHYYTDDPQVIVKSIHYVQDLLAKHPKLRCRTVFDEWNISLGWDRTYHAFQPCFICEATFQFLEAGLDLSCYYHIRDFHVSGEKFARFMSPAGNRFMTFWWNVMPQFHGLFDYQGHMRPSYFIFKMLSHLKGDRLSVRIKDSTVKCLAAYDPHFEVANILIWNFALDSPPKRRVKLSVTGLPGKKWRYYRRLLDAETASNDENDRLRLLTSRALDDRDSVGETFELPGYGVTFVSIKKFG
jgi:hypothetical protein